MAGSWSRRQGPETTCKRIATETRTSRPLPLQWRVRAGRPRRHSSAEALIVELPAHPIVTVATAQKLLGRSKQAVNEAIAVLAEKGVLHAIAPARRNRAWEARELFELVDDVERELAMPSGDDVPSRPTPLRGAKRTNRRRTSTKS